MEEIYFKIIIKTKRSHLNKFREFRRTDIYYYCFFIFISMVKIEKLYIFHI